MKAHQTWQFGNSVKHHQPGSSNRLDVLLARELGCRSVRRTRRLPRKWAVGLLVFVVAVATTVQVTSGGKFALFDSTPFQTSSEMLRETVEHQRHMQVAELAMFKLEQVSALASGKPSTANLGAALYRHHSLADLMWKPTATDSVRHQHIRPTRMALSQEARREVEFWRVVIQSNDPVLYRSYLRHFPAGTFALIAKSKTDLFKSARVSASNRTKPSAPDSDKVPQKPIVSASSGGQCNDQNGLCKPAKSVQRDCLATNTPVCVKRNYRPMERNTVAMEVQNHRR